MTFDLLSRSVLWHRSHTDDLAHLNALCPAHHAGPDWSELPQMADPERWCRRCAAAVHVLLAAWHATAGVHGPARLVAARLGHPVMQDPARWLLQAVEHGVCAERERATRWVSVVDARVAAWLSAAATAGLSRHGHRLVVLDEPSAGSDAHQLAALWAPFDPGPLADPTTALAAVRALARQ